MCHSNWTEVTYESPITIWMLTLVWLLSFKPCIRHLLSHKIHAYKNHTRKWALLRHCSTRTTVVLWAQGRDQTSLPTCSQLSQQFKFNLHDADAPLLDWSPVPDCQGASRKTREPQIVSLNKWSFNLVSIYKNAKDKLHNSWAGQ